ncbi:uncharacterized protein DFL_004031 [Arthrobotrys flagrans]|uniref:Uncharacterized protein n=1 Tax=Arthrobotrys flagrans TaxID=97331 RepID=A0A437A3R7_ARTFL|nr:hypothetical protein DFL_004031 [Arthrobotrys flagrans]
MTASRAAVSSAYKFLGSTKPPDFARILPPDAVFASAQKSGFLKCNKVEATTVLSAIWKTTQQDMQGNNALQMQQQQAVSVANICKAHNFSPSNFTSLALILQQSQNTTNNTPLQTDLLTLAELLNDPPAILKSAKSKISTIRSIPLLETTRIWKKLLYLANTTNIPEAHELIAETYQNAKSIQKAQEYWTKAAEAGSGKACLVMGRQAVVMGKRDVAVQAFERAKEFGEAEAYYELGVLQIKDGGGKVGRGEEAEYNLSVAAASGIIRAAVKLAEMYKARNDLIMGGQWEEVANEMKAIE